MTTVAVSEQVFPVRVTEDRYNIEAYGEIVEVTILDGSTGDTTVVVSHTLPAVTTLGGLLDVNASNAVDGALLMYASSSQKWEASSVPRGTNIDGGNF
jgi:hypothetical protein